MSVRALRGPEVQVVERLRVATRSGPSPALRSGRSGSSRGQPGHVRAEADAQEGGAQQVAALLRLLQQRGQPARQLGRSPRGRRARRGRRAGRMRISQTTPVQRSRRMASARSHGARALPSSGRRARRRRPPSAWRARARSGWFTRSARPLRGLQQPLRCASGSGFPPMATKATSMAQGAGDAVGLAGAQREQQVPRLEVGAAEHVDQAHAHADRPAGVDAEQVLRRDLALVALREARARGAGSRRAGRAARRGRRRGVSGSFMSSFGQHGVEDAQRRPRCGR